MDQITILDSNNAPIGPFTREQVAQKLQAGEVTLSSLAFVEGLAEWTKLSDVLARIDGTSAPSASVPSASTPPPYSYAATMQPPTHLVYAGFWIRFVAYLIDVLIISVALTAVIFVICIIIGIGAALMGVHNNPFGDSNSNNANPALVGLIIVGELVIFALELLVFWLYFAKLESGPAQATFGKRIFGLRVTDLQGERLTFGRASGRTFGKLVSIMTMYVGFIIAAFTERKQALHDMIAGTLVIKD
jgi:uncharacterized RDD family membrane protein YckC